MDKPKKKVRSISIDPITIHVGATAKRSSDGALLLNSKTYKHTPMGLVPNRELPQRITTNVLKQPHHKLPLKMLLSETARRGGDPNKASLPGSSQNFKPIKDMFQKPQGNDWKKSRLELLTDPRHLGKKCTASKRVAKMFQFVNPYDSGSGSLYGSSFEENPLPTNQASSLYTSNTILVTPRREDLESQSIIKSNNPCSTPHSLARFQNLYGNSFKQQLVSKEIEKEAQMEETLPFNVADVAEPISEMHAWCRGKALITPDNPTPVPHSPYYTNTNHDSRGLKELHETLIDQDEYDKENVQNNAHTPYFSQNFVKTVHESRYPTLEEDHHRKTSCAQFPQAQDHYSCPGVVNPPIDFGFGTRGGGHSPPMWQNDTHVNGPRTYQTSGVGPSRSADISYKVRETEYSFSFDSQESI